MRTRGWMMAVALAIGSVATTGCDKLGHFSAGHSKPTLVGEGPVKSETRSVGDFTKVSAGGSIELELEVGPATSVKVEAQENLVPAILTRLESGTLVIESEKELQSSEPIRVTVTTPKLEGLDLSGASHGNVKGVSSDAFDLDLSGASKLKLAGTAREIQLDASGASEAVLDGLQASSLTGEISGASTVLANGRADRILLDVSGASNFKGENLQSSRATLECSGASNVTLHVRETLNAQTSGASSVRYKGSPKVNADNSGAGSVSRMP